MSTSTFSYSVKYTIAFIIACLLTIFTLEKVFGAEAPASIKSVDAKVTINFPSSYKNKVYTIDDGHTTFKKAKLNKYGNAVVDLKTNANFRKNPNKNDGKLIIGIGGSSKSPYVRASNLTRTSGKSYLMFKEEFDAARDFEIAATYSADGYTKKLKQGTTLLKKDNVVGMEYSYMTRVATPKYVGSKYPIYAYTTTKQKPENGPDIIDAKGQFIFNQNFYPSIILR